MAADTSERLHALDAVRGFALTLGVVFHATMSYLPGPGLWPVKDGSESLVLSGLFFVLHMFRMTLFFLIAGFFARMMRERRGTAGFVKDRLKRIALPLVAFWPISIGSIAGLSIWAWIAMHPGQAAPPQPHGPVPFGSFPLTHLWFLWLLIWFYAAVLALRAPVAALDKAGRLRGLVDTIVRVVLVKNPLAPAVLCAPFLAALWVSPAWLQFFGIPTPDMNLIPNLPALAAYGAAFGLGWLLQRQPKLLEVFAGRWAFNLTLAIGLTAACFLIMGGARPIVTPAPRDAQTFLFAVCYGLAVWTWAFGLLGAALTFLSGHSPARRYMADASYWIYLVHLPLLLFLHGVMGLVHWPWEVEYPLILAIAFPIMLASYQLLVRYTWVGAILNGRRQPRPAKSAALPAPQGA
jgi:peptidoglycan/LPS O-acetylase OafA/YrhL